MLLVLLLKKRQTMAINRQEKKQTRPYIGNDDDENVETCITVSSSVTRQTYAKNYVCVQISF